MKILVTGATGFVGNYVVKTLVDKNISVIATSSNADRAMLLEWFDKVTYMPFDIQSNQKEKDLYEYFHQPDAMIHLAWEGLPNYEKAFHFTENLPNHFLFLKNLIDTGLNDLTVTGTCFEYGMQEGCLNEKMPATPDNAYAQAKDELRKKLKKMKNEKYFSFKWLRLFYMYGEGQNEKSLIPQLNKAIEDGDEIFNMSGGEQVRDFLPVEKVAEYIVACALQKKVDGIVNICSNQPITVKQFVLNYLQSINKKIELNLGYYPYSDIEPMRFWGDNTKLKSIVA